MNPTPGPRASTTRPPPSRCWMISSPPANNPFKKEALEGLTNPKTEEEVG